MEIIILEICFVAICVTYMVVTYSNIKRVEECLEVNKILYDTVLERVSRQSKVYEIELQEIKRKIYKE